MIYFAVSSRLLIFVRKYYHAEADAMQLFERNDGKNTNDGLLWVIMTSENWERMVT